MPEQLTRYQADLADRLLFRNLLERERRRLDREEQQFAEMDSLLPFA